MLASMARHDMMGRKHDKYHVDKDKRGDDLQLFSFGYFVKIKIVSNLQIV